MASDLIKTIKKASLDAINEETLQIMFGKVESTEPLKIKVGDTWTLTEEFIVQDAPVYQDEEVIVIKYSTGNKFLVLSTIEKVYSNSSLIGGVVNSGYSTSGQFKSLGMFTVTHYCCERYPHICNAGPPYTTATGTTPHVGGCAVDPRVIPLGSYVKMNGVVYHAEDTGGAIKGNRIDIVVPTHAEAMQRGKYTAEVFLKVGD